MAKLSVLMIGALVLAMLWIVDAITNTKLPDLRTGLHWPILAMVVVGMLATIFSVNPRLSLVGAYQSYDGLLALASFAVVALIAAESWRVDDLRRILTTFVLASGGLVDPLRPHPDRRRRARHAAGTGSTSSTPARRSVRRAPSGRRSATRTTSRASSRALLPIGVIVVISDRSVWIVRAITGVVLLGGLVCLVETSSLGGLARCGRCARC